MKKKEALAAKVNAENHEAEIEKAEALNVARVKAFLEAAPYSTKLYLRMKLKSVPDEFWSDHIVCLICHHIEKKSAYCIAQNVMRHEVTFTCKCGNKIICR